MTEYLIIPEDYIKASKKITASSPHYALSKYKKSNKIPVVVAVPTKFIFREE